jgi:hypothetical protein
LLVHPDGTVESRNTFFAKVTMAFALRSFPFDSQTVRIELESFSWELDEMVLMNRTDVIGFSDEFKATEWSITEVTQRLLTRTEQRDGATYSRVEAAILIARHPGVYVTKILLPLALITLMTMVVFWLDAGIFGSVGEMLSLRLGTSFTGLLTAVAYQFIVAANVPRHVYNTYLDAFVGVSFAAIAMSIAETVWIGYLSGRQEAERAARLDSIARWVGPVCYLGAVAGLYVLYTR